jgi:hypothetical protein
MVGQIERMARFEKESLRLLLVGHGSRACDWSGYALLRDNVQHFIEGGEPTDRFTALHGIERAVDDGQCFVDAARLRGEVLRAWYALSRVPLEQAAVSLRTRAILTASTEAPTARGTVLAQKIGWALPVNLDGSEAVAEAAKSFVTAVLALTERVVDGDRLEVRRYGAAPRFAEYAPDGEQAMASVRRPTVMGLALKTACVGLLAVGCSAGWTPPPKAPPGGDVEQKSTNVEQRPDRDEHDPVFAPPPAYGNKVVRRQAHQHSGPRPASRHN